MVVTRSQTQDTRQNKRTYPKSKTERFGLIQEELQNNLYHLIVQAILWNQTRGKQARPILDQILSAYPTPNSLACANETTLTEILFPIGLHKQRAKRLIAMAKEWQRLPPNPKNRFKARAPGYEIGSDAQNPGWEVAHLPGVGPYALDSYRIFYRDQLLGLSKGWQANPDRNITFQPEWKRVIPSDKDLRMFLQWAWRKEGYKWDPITGHKVKLYSSPNTVK